ncbi:hypothetical protein [Thermococcus sp. MV5]|uniref:hypothetical protein n=1 Tax=Thermococcus sp. MV5 TaxID=1638272 RepID=UPI00143A9852|nr:hypothetical protein [Thermococcus sp. MV5]
MLTKYFGALTLVFLVVRRAKIEDRNILEEIHAGEPPWENFEVYLKAIRGSGGDIFLYEDKAEIELLPFNGEHVKVKKD